MCPLVTFITMTAMGDDVLAGFVATAYLVQGVVATVGAAIAWSCLGNYSSTNGSPTCC